MATRVLLDANVVIRFLVRDDEVLYQKSYEVMKEIEQGKIEELLMYFILAEIIYVLKCIYKINKIQISNTLKKILRNDS